MGAKGTIRVDALVVDDTAVDRRLMQFMLQHLNLRVELAANGLTACEKLQENTIPMVFMDLEMPIMNGLDASREIRTILPEDRQPCIIAVTSSEISLARCQAAGINALLKKPIRLAQVSQLLWNLKAPDSTVAINPRRPVREAL
jgi:CheY-like chemotaxis protein